MILVGCLVIVAPSVYFLHAYQVKRQADVYLQHAREAEEAGNAPEAIDHLLRYLDVVPNDNEALAQLGQLFAETRRWNEAFGILEQVLRRDPSRVEARTSLAEASLALGRYNDAREQLEIIISQAADDAETHVLLAACHAAGGQWRDAAIACERAIEKDPAHLTAYQQLAVLQRNRIDDPVAAERTIDRVVAQNPSSASALVLRGVWRLRYCDDAATIAAVAAGSDVEIEPGRQEVLAQARSDAEKAMQLEPENADAVRLAASISISNSNFEEARALADKAIKISPNASNSFALRAQVEAADENPEQASHWLRKAIQVSPGDETLVWAFANSLLDEPDIEQSEKAIRSLNDVGYESARLRFLEARLAVVKQQWREAVDLFEACLPGLVESPDLAKQAHLLQANCYRQLQRPELEIAALKRAISVDPNWAVPRRDLAAALKRVGRRDEASDHMRQLATAAATANAEELREIGQLIYVTASRPEDQQNWKVIHQQIDQEISSKDNPLFWVLKADAHLKQGDLDAAREVLQEARDAYPKNLQIWMSSVLVSAQSDRWEQTERLLADAADQLESPVPFRLLHAQLIVNQFQEKGREQLLQLAVPPESYDTREELELLIGIGQIFWRLGELAEAKQLFQAAGDLAPNNLNIRLSLFDLAFHGQDLKAMESALAEVKAIDEDGPYWKYGEALRLALKSNQENDVSHLELAESLLLEARMQLSNLRQIPLLLARIYDGQKKQDQAATYYLEAFDAGERETKVLERTLAILLEKRQSTEFQRIIDKLQEEGISPTDNMQRMMAENHFRQGRLSEAIELGQRLVSENASVSGHLWLGKVLAQAGQLEKADSQFQLASKLAPEEPASWAARLKLWQNSENKEKLAEVVKSASEVTDSIPVSIATAQATWSLDGAQAADDRFSEMLLKHPNNGDVLQSVIQFKIQTRKSTEAKKLLEKLVSLEKSTEEQQRWGRRNLAVLAASTGSRSGLEEATTLVQTNLDERDEVEDQLTLARILASTGEPKLRRQAISILESLKSTSSLGRDEQFLLANLRYSSFEYDSAATLMRELIADSPENAAYLQRFVETLVEQEQFAEATIWLDSLKKIAPQNLAALDLEASIYLQRDNHEQLSKLLVSFATNLSASSGQSDELSRKRQLAFATMLDKYIAMLRRKDPSLTQIEELSSASKSLWDHFSEFAPADGTVQALQSARRGDVQAAVDWLKAPITDASPEQLALVGSSVIASQLAAKEQLNQLDKATARLLESYPTSVDLRLLQADLQGRLGQSDAAIKNYRKVLEKNQNNIIALNNLAALLALSGVSPSEGLECIDRAIDVVGARATLLDTRGMVLIAAERYPEAIADLQQAIDSQATSVKFFHLALANYRLNSQVAALEAWQEAKKRGIARSNLHPLESESFLQLEEWAENQLRQN